VVTGKRYLVSAMLKEYLQEFEYFLIIVYDKNSHISSVKIKSTGLLEFNPEIIYHLYIKMSKKCASLRFDELISVMARLRGKNGCPWDKHQDHNSLLPYLFSEADEVKQAINKSDWDNLKEELGDILLQVVFHSRIAQENGLFDINGVIDTLVKKLKRRHPHVFGGKKLTHPHEVAAQWEKIKEREKRNKKIKR